MVLIFYFIFHYFYPVKSRSVTECRRLFVVMLVVSGADSLSCVFRYGEFLSVAYMRQKAEIMEHPVKVEITTQIFYRDKLARHSPTRGCPSDFSDESYVVF